MRMTEKARKKPQVKSNKRRKPRRKRIPQYQIALITRKNSNQNSNQNNNRRVQFLQN